MRRVGIIYDEEVLLGYCGSFAQVLSRMKCMYSIADLFQQ